MPFPLSRKRYLLDRQTGLLYTDVPATDWPLLVAELVPANNRERERIEPIDNAAATTEFFNSLDTYLKSQKVMSQRVHQSAVQPPNFLN